MLGSIALRPAGALLLTAAVVAVAVAAKHKFDRRAEAQAVASALAAAARLTPPTFGGAFALTPADPRSAALRALAAGNPLMESRSITPGDSEKLQRAASIDASIIDSHSHVPTKGLIARNALDAVSSPAERLDGQISAYGEIGPNIFASRRLTILQLGDSHTAADFFTGQVRERLQRVFGAGGDAYLVPGTPHIGVRSALFESMASGGWTYEALQKSEDRRRFYLSGFNAVARRAGASLSLVARGGRAYDRLEVAFLRQPGGGRAELFVDGKPGGQISLDGVADERATLDLHAPETVEHGFHEVVLRTLSDAPVTVTGVEVGRDGDGVSYISLGFPGATVQLLQKLVTENLADDLRRLAPDMIVLAFGTNEGFNDALDVGAYTAQYEQIVRKLQELRPGVRLILVGPPDGARPAGAASQLNATGGGGQCRLSTPPKLAMVREAQRRLAERVGAQFWDWSSAMPEPCGAQAWAAASPPLMARDYVHMTVEGYKRSADQFADFLIPLIDGGGTPTHVVSNN